MPAKITETANHSWVLLDRVFPVSLGLLQDPELLLFLQCLCLTVEPCEHASKLGWKAGIGGKLLLRYSEDLHRAVEITLVTEGRHQGPVCEFRSGVECNGLLQMDNRLLHLA